MTTRQTLLTGKASRLSLRKIEHAGWTEYFLTASTRDYTPLEWLALASRVLEEYQATAVAGDVFGTLSFLRSLAEVWGSDAPLRCPWNFLAGRLSAESTEGGYQLHAISGVALQPVWAQDRLVGYWFENETARHCFLSDLRPLVTEATEARQTEEVFTLTETALRQVGLNFHDVARTWFYLDRILDWYPDFNRVRTDYFQTRDIFGGIMPASTGVGAGNLSGAALLTKAYVVRPKSELVQVRRVQSPLQCDAYQYGSAFSRALEVADAGARSLFISGTASIEPGGKTVHVGDVNRQIELTMRVVEAMLTQQGMTWADTVRALAYFRHEKDLAQWKTLGEPYASLPIVATQCDVCRDDLLFEIELQAGAA